MALLDGKYEITSQQILSDEQNQFDVIAPDGSALRIVWFELNSGQEEQQFERYRRALKKLQKQNLAAIHDIVSRPGTHYVAWKHEPKKKQVASSKELKEALEHYGFAHHSQLARQASPNHIMLYDLAFDATGTFELLSAESGQEDTEEQAQPLKERQPVPQWVWSWSLAVILAFISSGLFTLGFLRRANTETVTVPDIIGQNVNDASLELHNLGLRVSTTAVVSEESIGQVVAVSPDVGSELKPFYRTVQISYALPAEQIALKEVPQLRGEPFSPAIQRSLESAGLRLGDVAYIYSNNPRGLIIAQSAEAGSQLQEKTRVSVLVSQGPEPIRTFLPDLTGLSLENALYMINLAGLGSPDVTRQASTHFPEGTVISQNIPPNVLVPVESTAVRLTVAGSSTPVSQTRTAPYLIGLSREEARQVASNYNLRFEEIDTPNLPPGVVDQTPGSNEAATSNMTLLINTYTPPITIPVPRPSAEVKPPQLRRLSFKFDVELGIPSSVAEVTARTADGNETIALSSSTVTGGSTVEGNFFTTTPGPVTFTLKLNGVEYRNLRVNP